MPIEKVEFTSGRTKEITTLDDWVEFRNRSGDVLFILDVPNKKLIVPSTASLEDENGTPIAGGGSTERVIEVVIGDGSAELTTGIKTDLSFPFACTITGARLLADQSGSVVVDLWKDSYANFPPTNADSICASAKPTLSSAAKSDDTTLTGWTKAISAGDIIRVNVDSVATITRLTLALTVE